MEEGSGWCSFECWEEGALESVSCLYRIATYTPNYNINIMTGLELRT